MIGTAQTRLIVLRGNSGSGKTTVARALQQRRGPDQLAVVSQDVVRRDVLRAKDWAGNPAIGLMDLMARYALDHGFSVIVEGMLHPDRYSEMLTKLAQDHCGPTVTYFWDLPLEETLRRHATRPQAVEVGEADLREWWMGSAYVDGLAEATIGADESLDEAIERIESDCGWS